MKKIIILIMCIFLLTACKDNLPLKTKIIPSDTFEYIKYENNEMTMDIPKGYEVNVLSTNPDYYTFTLSKKGDSNYMMYVNLKNEGFLKSEKAKEVYSQYNNDDISMRLPIIETKDTLSYYLKWNEIAKVNNQADIKLPVINEIKENIHLGTTKMGGDIIWAAFVGDDNKYLSGIFITDFVEGEKTYLNSEKGNESSTKVDVSKLNIYNSIFIITPAEQLINYEREFASSLESIKFKNDFLNKITDDNIELKSDGNALEYLGININTSWQNRDVTFFAKQEKYYDKVLGNNRIYDNKQDKVYKCSKDFYLNNKNKRYETLTEEKYLTYVSGYITYDK